jgi:outer membrane protein assembly factor BamD (BamD/ComL family)
VTAPVVSILDQAARAFSAGNYEEAAKDYESFLHSAPPGAPRDFALFYLGLCFALRPPGSVDWPRATASFKLLVEGYPSSPYTGPASLILSLRSDLDQLAATGKQREQQLKQLSTELDRLKKIDADRRRRP